MTPALISTPKGEKRIQEIIGALLYYARAFHNKLLLALSAIGDQQAAATEDTSDTIKQILDYVVTYPNDGIVYRASNMVLSYHSDVGFRNKSKGRSRSGLNIFLSDNDPEPICNGPVLPISQIINFVMT